jgi:hypothetical protein
MIYPPSSRQYKPGNLLAVRQLNWDLIIDEDDDEEDLRDPGAPSSGRTHPGDGNVNDDDEGDDDMQNVETGTGNGMGTKDGKGNGMVTEDKKGKGKGKRKGKRKGKWKGNGKEKGIVKQTSREMKSLVLLLCSFRRTCVRLTRTWRANKNGYIYSQKHCPPVHYAQRMIPTQPIQMVNMTQNVILMWICAWRMMWTHRTALISMALWIWKGTVRMKMRKMNRRKIRRRRRRRMRIRMRMRMRRRIRMRIVAENLRRLTRETW